MGAGIGIWAAECGVLVLGEDTGASSTDVNASECDEDEDTVEATHKRKVADNIRSLPISSHNRQPSSSTPDPHLPLHHYRQVRSSRPSPSCPRSPNLCYRL